MKFRIALTLLFSAAFAVTGFSQERRAGEDRVKAIMEKITPALNLSAAQASATDSVYRDYYKGFEKLREQRQAGTRPDRSIMEKMNSERDDKLKKIFTAEQYKKFKDEVEASLRPQRGGGTNRR